MALLSPEIMFENVGAITPAYLRQHRIGALVLDVDNTLTAHDSQTVPPVVAQWLAQMRAEGIAMTIVSNNSAARVTPFAKQLGLPFCANGCKPLPHGLAAARRAMGCSKEQMAVVGDQLFTDVLAARLYGVPVLLVQPLYEDTKRLIRLKRKLEEPILARYFRRGGILIQKEVTQHE